MNRCRNCGSEDHATQGCQVFGPWFPEPGKTREDYLEQDEKIGSLVAADILAEHEWHKERP